MAVSTDELLDEIGRAAELLAPLTIAHPNVQEAFRIVTQVGFVLAAEQHADVDEDDGYDADYLTEQDEDRDAIAEVIAMGDRPPFFRPREYDREAHIERDLR